MVRDPCCRFTENASFVPLVEKTKGPVSLMGQTNHETPMTNRATVEPSSVLRDSRATIYPVNRQHLEKCRYGSSNQIVLSLSINFPGTTETRIIAQAPCVKTGMK